ncbi:hypothetical protein [Pseudomonas sp. TWP3-2]|uniref:hypothetical protein n=1 Tax=Pseudomonas sp. TWP3-2 TaxID=2804574 RepID=UPI003CF16ED1
MTAQQSGVAPVVLSEAVGGVLYMETLSDPTSARVPSYQNVQVGDKIKLSVNTSTGNAWSYEVTLTPATVGNPIEFGVPKGTFEQNLVSGATADLHYKITNPVGNPVTSPVLRVQLQR